jgi:hypothetical protein
MPPAGHPICFQIRKNKSAENSKLKPAAKPFFIRVGTKRISCEVNHNYWAIKFNFSTDFILYFENQKSPI